MLTIITTDWCTLIVGRHKERPLQRLANLVNAFKVYHCRARALWPLASKGTYSRLFSYHKL